MSDAAIKADLQALAPSAIIELFVFDPSTIDEGASVYRFHAGTNKLRGDLVWQGNTYTAFPIEVTGFDISSSGKSPRPRIKVSNIFGVFFELSRTYGDLVGAKVIRKRTLAKFLDNANFVGGVNPSGLANPSEQFPDDIFFVEQKVSITREFAEFELVSVLDLEGVMLPRMMVTSSFCAFAYRSVGCDYTGVPVAQRNDSALGVTPVGYVAGSVPEWNSGTSYTTGQVVWNVNPRRLFVAKGSVPAGTPVSNLTYWVEDQCGKRISSCKCRFGATGILNAGFYPGVNRLPV